MKVYINERSIDRQACNHKEAMCILSALAKIVLKSRTIAYEGKAFRTKCFSQREIIDGVSVKSVLVEAVAKQSLSDEVARKLTLQTLMSRPYTENRHLHQDDAITDAVGNCLKNSCFDDASESKSGSLIISATKDPYDTAHSLSYTSSLFGMGSSYNVSTDDMLEAITWVFEHNPKHGNTPRKIAGVTISEMDLTNEQAQLTLSNGIKVNDKIYGHFNDNWYQFHCHHANKYHGFKITMVERYREHMTALNKLTSLDYKTDCGQVFVHI